MTETSMTKALTALLREQGAIVYPAIGGPGRPVGWPDRWVARNGWSAWLEVKMRRWRVSKAQRATLEALQGQGVAVWVVRLMEGRTCDIERPDGTVVIKEVRWVFLLDILEGLET